MLARKREQYKKAEKEAAPREEPSAAVGAAVRPPVKPLYISCLVDDIASIVHGYCIIVTNPAIPPEDGPSLPVAFKLHTNFPFRYRVLPAPFGVIPTGQKITLQIFVRSPPEQREAELATKLRSSNPDGNKLFLEEPPKKGANSIATLLKYTDRRAADTGQMAISPNPHERRSSYLNFRSSDEKGRGGGGGGASRSMSDEYRARSSTQNFLVKRLSDNLSFPRTADNTVTDLPPRRRALSAESAVCEESAVGVSASDNMAVVIESDIVSDILRLEFRQVEPLSSSSDKNEDADAPTPAATDPGAAMLVARVVEDPSGAELSHSAFRKLWNALKTRTWSDVIPLQAELISDKDYEDAMNSVKSKFVRDLEREKRQLEMCIQQLRSQKVRLEKDSQDIEAEASRLRMLEKISAEITRDELHFLAEVKMASESSFSSCVGRLLEAEEKRRQKCLDVELHARTFLQEECRRQMPPPSRRRLKLTTEAQTVESGPPPAAPAPQPTKANTTVVPRWIGILAVSTAFWSVLRDAF